MPTTERYTLNDLQQATLDVMAANVMPGDDEDLARAAMTREDIIAGVQAVPGQDEVNGNHMGPTMACLKRRGLVAEASWPAKGQFHITPAGITYVDLDGEPEAEEPRPEYGFATDEHAETASAQVAEIIAQQQAPMLPSRDEILTQLVMEVAPVDWWDGELRRLYEGHVFGWNEYQLRREELINKPSWEDAPEWAQWLAQDGYGGWWWYDQKPVSSDHDGSFDAPGQSSETSEGAIPAGHDWRETLESRPATQAPSAGASTTACDDQHRPEPAEQDAEIEAVTLANRDAVIAREQALKELDDARSRELNPITSSLTNHQAEERALEEGTCSDGTPCGEPTITGERYCEQCPNKPSGAPEVTILSVAVHPPGTAWLDNDATVLIKVMDEGSGPYLDISSWDGPAAIESLEMLEAVTNTARTLLREAEAREVGA